MEEFFGLEHELLIDATERPTQCPKNEELQKEGYSGKKVHTLKNTVISGKNQWIYFLGKTISGGKTHDFKLLKEEFEVGINWFKNFKVWLDLGYQGFATIL